MPESKLARLAKSGEIKKNTLVISPTRTKNRWIEAKDFPALAKMIEDALLQARKEKSDSKQVAIVEATVVEPSGVEANPQIDNKLAERLKDFLMAGEEIEFVCLQIKKMALKRDGIVATNMRFIMAKPKMLGRFEFIDCMWIDLYDAHVKEGILGSTFEIYSHAGRYSMEYLAKKDARKIYQIAQNREQAVRWQRRQLEMEEKSAGATQINIGQPAAAQPPAQLSPPADDPMAKLAKLKQMVDAGLIEQAEYDSTKARILESF